MRLKPHALIKELKAIANLRPQSISFSTTAGLDKINLNLKHWKDKLFVLITLKFHVSS